MFLIYLFYLKYEIQFDKIVILLLFSSAFEINKSMKLRMIETTLCAFKYALRSNMFTLPTRTSHKSTNTHITVIKNTKR